MPRARDLKIGSHRAAIGIGGRTEGYAAAQYLRGTTFVARQATT